MRTGKVKHLPPAEVSVTSSSRLHWYGDNYYAPRFATDAARQLMGDAVGFHGRTWVRPPGLREFDTWVVDGQWVVRIARRPAEAAKLERERRLLDAVTLPVVVPRIERWSMGIAVHRFVPGLPAEPRPREPTWPRLAAELGSLLTVLHATPSEVWRAAGLETQLGDGDDARRESLDRALAELEQRGVAVPAGATPGHLLPAGASDSSRLVVCYGDFKGEHVLLSEDQTSVAGVIDWADVEVRPVEADFASLIGWMGPRFGRIVADHYDGTVDLDRAVAGARYWVITSLADAVSGRPDWPLEMGLTEERHKAKQVARAGYFQAALRAVFDE